MVAIEEARTIVSNVNSLLKQDSTKISEEFGQVLQNLGGLIQKTNQDPSILNKCSSDKELWQLIKRVIETKISNDEVIEMKVRLVRGVLILARNLITHIDGVQHFLDLEIIHHIFETMGKINEISVDKELKTNLNIVVLQFLSNFSNVIDVDTHKQYDQISITELSKFITYNNYWNEDLNIPFFTYLDNLSESNQFLYLGLSHGDGKPIFDRLLTEYEKIELENHEYSSLELLIIKVFKKLIIHESFLKFITVHNNEEFTVRYYKVAEAVITSKSNWEVFELTVILSWTYDLLKDTIPKVEQYFKVHEEGEEPIFIYEIISRSLDIFTSLVQFEHTRKFLFSYKGVENLVHLLGTLNMNIKALRLKDSEKVKKQDGKIDYKAFPHTKSMIIEILSALVYNNFEVQELMRETHGLELVLSNCIIDDNEPFIKERSIVCLRFLLLENEKNQEFVSKMEAKQAIPDETLDEAGYEVDIVDGKVKLKQKQKIEELKEEN